MDRYNNNRGAGIIGGSLEKLKIVFFLRKHISFVTDTFTFEFLFCLMHFLRHFLAFIQKLCLLSFHFSRN